jgi:ketosteroid isomerase-like protein
MSEENVDLARRYVEAFNSGGLDATRPLRTSTIEIVDPPTMPDADTYVGEAAARARVESYMTFGWDGQFREVEYIDAGEEVIVVWRLQGRGALGGVPLDIPTLAHIYAFEGDKVKRIRQYMTKAEALEAAGLSE